MAYSDYGGYAYRNGERVLFRSDATISPDGDIFGSPGMWPGCAAVAQGGIDELERRKEWPSGHVVLGDGPLYVSLYKQSTTQIYRVNSEVDIVSVLVDAQGGMISSYGENAKYINTDFFRDSEKPCVFEVDGYKLTVFYLSEDNYYQYAKLVQPDGNVWLGFSGYGVGAGLEDADYGYSTEDRIEKLFDLFGVEK